MTQGHPRRRYRLRVASGLVFFLVALIIVSFTTIHKWFTIEHMITWVKTAQASVPTAIVFYLVFIVAVLMLPITLFPIVGGVLLDFWIALPLNMAAATLGSTLAFFIARLYGRQTVEHLLKGKLKHFDEMAASQGLKTVLFLRWTGLPPFLLANYALGLSGVKTSDFVLGTFFGIMPWMALVTYASGSLWQAVLMGGDKGLTKALAQTLGPLMGLSIGILLTTALVYWNKRSKSKAVGKSA